MVEIERKFLLESRPEWLDGCPSERIEQGYLALADEVEVRLRRLDGERTLLTVKRGAGRRREEAEVKIDAGAFEELWPLTEAARVLKRRYRREVEAGTLEIDVYEGELAGMTVMEIEFEDEEAAENFDPPDWVDREVTDDERYANRALASQGRP